MAAKNSGVEHAEAVVDTVKAINKPSLYSALTTSVGLFSLAMSDIPPVKSIAVIGGMGVLLVYLLVIYVLPPLLIRFASSGWRQNSSLKAFLDNIVNYAIELSLTFPKRIVIGLLLGALVLSYFAFQVESESNLYKFFSDDHRINKATEAIAHQFSGTTIVNVVFDSDPDSILSSKFLKNLDDLKGQIEAIEGISRVFSPADVLKQMHWAFHGEKQEFFAVPDDDSLIQQYFFIYDGDDLYNFLSRSQKRLKMTLNLDVQGANEIEGVVAQVEERIKSIGFTDVQWRYGGHGKMFSDQENLIISDLFKSVAVSFSLILLLMAIMWQSFRDALYCFIPNFLPVLSMFILMGMFGIWLDMGTAMIASVTVGIAVDDTIHIFNGYRKRIGTLPIKDIIHEVYNESGRAIIITTLILSSQFAVLSFASFAPLRNFGLLTTTGVLAALVFDLLFLPALIVLVHKRNQNITA
ncbi:MAG: MMPL family transporter [Bdellovibrionales bacterium]